MAKRLTILGVCLLVVTATGCKSRTNNQNSNDASHSTEQARTTEASTSACDVVPASIWIRLWRDSATQKATYSTDQIDEIAQIITDALTCVGAPDSTQALTAMDETTSRASMKQFLASHLDGPVKKARVRGYGYWLAFCIAESQKRRSADFQSNKQKSDEAYQRTAKRISDDLIRPRFRKVLSAEDYQRWGSEIESGLRLFEDTLMDRIRAYRSDPLVPVFRSQQEAPVASMETLTDWIAKSKWFPAYVEPTSLMTSKDEEFRRKLKWFFSKGVVDMSLVSIFLYEIQLTIKYNEYWGYMQWGAESLSEKSGGQHWPMRVWIMPDEIRNRQKGWKRSQGK